MTAGPGAHANKTLSFPSEISLGTLQIRDWGISGGWQLVGHARGEVPVPAAKELRLKAAPDACGHLEALRGLNLDDIHWLDLSDTPVTDEALAHVEGLHLLRRLDLRNTPVTNAAMTHIKKLSSLKELRLTGTKVDDAGMVCLKELLMLENLWLNDTGVTGAAVPYLKPLKSLKVLQLPRGVSHAAAAELQQALPECYVNIQR